MVESKMAPPPRAMVTARAAAIVLEAMLWLALAATLVNQVVRPLLSEALLRVGRGPFWGSVPSVPARLSDSTWHTAVEQMGGSLPPALRHEFSGPYERGGYVDVTIPTGVEISVWDPMTFRQMVGVAGAELLGGLVITAALLLTILIVHDLRRGELFSPRNLRRVYVVAAVVGAGGMLAQVAAAWGRVGVLESPRIAGVVDVAWTVSFTPLIVGLAIAVGAEILRLGMRMQDEVRWLV
jgi:hypothetical protein